ncbi:MAG: hypothetical protein ACRDSN_11525, partial [Pseudonocardiaceae bacterium]
AGSVVVAVTTIALAGEGTESRSAPTAEAFPHTGCAEGTQAARPKRGRDLIVGPVAFLALVRRNGEPVSHSNHFRRKPGRRYTPFKAGALVKRGTVATIIVPRSP